MRLTVARNGVSAFLLLFTLAACGGGGGGGGGSGSGNPIVAPTSFPVGGTVTGLSSSGLVLLDNAGDPLSIGANGAFTFATSVPNGSVYDVTVGTQPNIGPLQICTVTNGSGECRGSVGHERRGGLRDQGRQVSLRDEPTANNVSGYTINASTWGAHGHCRLAVRDGTESALRDRGADRK